VLDCWLASTPSVSVATFAGIMTVVVPAADGRTLKVKRLSEPEKEPIEPLVTWMSEEVKPETPSLNVAVIGMELRFVVDDAVDDRTTAGPPASAKATPVAASSAATEAPAKISVRDFITLLLK